MGDGCWADGRRLVVHLSEQMEGEKKMLKRHLIAPIHNIELAPRLPQYFFTFVDEDLCTYLVEGRVDAHRGGVLPELMTAPAWFLCWPLHTFATRKLDAKDLGFSSSSSI